MVMAKSQTIDEMLKKLKDNYKDAMVGAVTHAVNVGVKDVYKFTVSCLDQYYQSHDPTIYDRTDSLKETFVPIAEVATNGDVVSGTIGIAFDSTVLMDKYYRATCWGRRQGIQDPDRPEALWVLENFLDGIHPATDGSPEEGAPYIPWEDPWSTDQLLNRYLRLYQNKFKRNVTNYLVSYAIQ